jgi:transcriptional regulator with GAF, ATPase, and Fis domain
VVNRETLLADTFLRLADTLVDDFDVIDVLSTLSSRCVELLDAAASGIAVVDARGRLQVMAASSEAANVLELFQVHNGEGPCQDAFRLGIPVADGKLRLNDRWPRFAPLAVAAGFEAVHAFPLVVRANVLGSLTLLMSKSGSLGDADVVIAQALAHAATLTLLQNQAAEDAQRLTGQLQGALNSRITIEQAKGVISELAHVTTDEAFVRLRSFARNHNTKLTDLAGDVVRRTLDRDALEQLLVRRP